MRITSIRPNRYICVQISPSRYFAISKVFPSTACCCQKSVLHVRTMEKYWKCFMKRKITVFFKYLKLMFEKVIRCYFHNIEKLIVDNVITWYVIIRQYVIKNYVRIQLSIVYLVPLKINLNYMSVLALRVIHIHVVVFSNHR